MADKSSTAQRAGVPMPATATHAAPPHSRRRFVRVRGPFDGRRVGLLTVPVTIHDLSVGGCLIQAYHEEPAGRRFPLEIELPVEGWVQVQAESLYSREGYGFAVRFVEMDESTREGLARAIERLR
jgi:hypothetical protein